MIGDDVVVKILGVSHHQIRIGIDAPPEVTILREELIGRDFSSNEKEE